MTTKSCTIATTNFGDINVKHLRYFYITFSLQDTLNNTTLLQSNALITVTIKADRDTTEEYFFIPIKGYQKKKIPLKHTHRGVWWTFDISSEYDLVLESGECLIIPIIRR